MRTALCSRSVAAMAGSMGAKRLQAPHFSSRGRAGDAISFSCFRWSWDSITCQTLPGTLAEVAAWCSSLKSCNEETWLVGCQLMVWQKDYFAYRIYTPLKSPHQLP